MTHPVIRRYQIGLAAIGVFTLVVVVMVLLQASATKQDTSTTKAANDIATKLDAYISSAGTIPSNLGGAAVGTVPSTISYQKLSETKYKFCVTYKSDSSDFDANAVVSDVATGSYGSSYSSLNSSASTGDTTYLYIPTSHHKGQNCQTITPYLGGTGIFQPLDLPSSGSSSSLIPVFGDVQSKARDTERTTDLKTLQSQLEAFFASNGYYPTLADLNDSSWVSTNMKGMDQETMRDPQGSDKKLVATPTAKAYAYQPLDQNQKNCTTEGDCQSYTLTATPETGNPIIITSLE